MTNFYGPNSKMRQQGRATWTDTKTFWTATAQSR